MLTGSSTQILFPSLSVFSLDQVFYNGVTGSFVKHITIQNNSPDQTVYAFVEGELTRQAVSPYDGTSAFDPFDAVDQEYRGYIGYTDGTNNIAGLPPESSITITVPLAFWDSARINFSTDGTDQFATYNPASPAGSPFYYQDVNTQAAFFASIDTSDNSKLDFTPIYNSFDPSNGYLPSTKKWQSPVATGVFQNGQVYKVTGPGLPPSGALVTINSSNPDFVTLPQAFKPQTTGPQEYVFSIQSASSISPTDKYIQGNFPMTGPAGQTTNGEVMWYHALYGQIPNNDAPFQLMEFSLRGSFYNPTANPTARFEPLIGSAFPGTDVDSADYDVSFVDSLNVPIAIEAENVTVPVANVQEPFGWVGSSQSISDMQQTIAQFTSANPSNGTNANYLGTYFGGNGYPTYLSIDPGDLKIPGGQNLFLATPAAGATADVHYYKSFPDNSTLTSTLYALSTGTSGPTQIVLGGDVPNQEQNTNNLALTLSNDAQQYALNDLILQNIATSHATYDVTYNGGVFLGHVVGPYKDSSGNVIGVQLDVPVPPNAGDQVYTFTQPQYDYAASRIAGLWYSWAKYYVEKVTSIPAPDLPGTFVGNIVTLAKAQGGLVPGMAVTGGGVAPGTVVLSVGSDNRTIELSAVPTGNPTSFTFVAPSMASIVGYDSSPNGNTPPVDLSFAAGDPSKDALAFAQTVFTVMSAWSVSVAPGTANAWSPLMVNIIGGNLNNQYLPNGNLDVVNALTVLSKSALRGVPDYTSPLYSNKALWYPDPALPAGGQTFNVFNLDPYVWFVHRKLGLTAYAFSLDDDIGNVQGGGATQMNIGVGGLGGLVKTDPYTATSQWGIVTSDSTTQAGTSTLASLTNPNVVGQILGFDYSKNLAGTIVNGTGVAPGTYTQFTSIVASNLAQSTITLSSPLASGGSGQTYDFFGPLVFIATVPSFQPGQPTNVIYLKGQQIHDTLSKVGPLENLQVTGEGIDPSQTVIITGSSWNPQTQIFTIQLSSNLMASQISEPGGFYAFTFGNAPIPPVRDPGFEWISVQGGLGYNHGQQLTADVPDWTFTDSSTNAKWFAGIAYNNTSPYTSQNPVAPQGVQVGFIQGDSSISQNVTLAQGNYTLKLQAARSGTFHSGETLRIMLGTTPIGIVAPTGTTYQPFAFNLSVPSSGTYALSIVGTQASTSTVLFDAIAIQPGSLLSRRPGQRHPSTVQFLAQPVGMTARSPLAPVTIAVFDRFGNPWSGVNVQLVLIPIGGSKGHFTRGSVIHATTINGVATFSNLAISAPGRYVLRAELGRQRVKSHPLVIVAKAHSRVAPLVRRHLVGPSSPKQGSPGASRAIHGGHAV